MGTLVANFFTKVPRHFHIERRKIVAINSNETRKRGVKSPIMSACYSLDCSSKKDLKLDRQPASLRSDAAASLSESAQGASAFFAIDQVVVGRKCL